jgi:hypothetical protein
MRLFEGGVMGPEPSRKTRRLAGLLGVSGALLFFAGDMLFYGHLGPGATFRDGMLATVRQASPARLFAGGLVGPVAACLCMVGFWHVAANVRGLPGWRQIVFASFSILMVSGSAIHTLWTAKGLALKYCSGEAGPCGDLLPAINSYWSLVYDLGVVPGFVGAFLLLVLVLSGRTWYPKWTVIVNPALLTLAEPLVDRIPAPIGAVLVGGSTNLSIALFFLVSTWTTWSRGE